MLAYLRTVTQSPIVEDVHIYPNCCNGYTQSPVAEDVHLYSLEGHRIPRRTAISVSLIKQTDCVFLYKAHTSAGTKTDWCRYSPVICP